MANPRMSQQDQAWTEVRRRYRLSHAQVQMAQELGMNPKKFGKIANHRQEPWKAPLPLFIEGLYSKRFGRDRPAVVVTVEERARQREAKKATRKLARARAREQATDERHMPEVQARDESD